VATLILIGTILSLAFIAVGLASRFRRGRRIDSATTMELAFDAIQLGATLAAGVYPTGYLLISMSRNGGTIEQNLPRGVNNDFALGVLVVGMIATVIYTSFNYRKHL